MVGSLLNRFQKFPPPEWGSKGRTIWWQKWWDLFQDYIKDCDSCLVVLFIGFFSPPLSPQSEQSQLPCWEKPTGETNMARWQETDTSRQPEALNLHEWIWKWVFWDLPKQWACKWILPQSRDDHRLSSHLAVNLWETESPVNNLCPYSWATDAVR